MEQPLGNFLVRRFSSRCLAVSSKDEQHGEIAFARRASLSVKNQARIPGLPAACTKTEIRTLPDVPEKFEQGEHQPATSRTPSRIPLPLPRLSGTKEQRLVPQNTATIGVPLHFCLSAKDRLLNSYNTYGASRGQRHTLHRLLPPNPKWTFRHCYSRTRS